MAADTIRGSGMTSERARERLIEHLRTKRGIEDQRVLNVMRQIPRHIFLDEALSTRAYDDCSLPIGFQQTLSQPYIVARMTEILINVSSMKRVLEIGTGSGYQTAVLSPLCEKLFTVERIKPLQDKAKDRIRLLKMRNVNFKYADGNMGWPQQGPYDAILATAAPEQVPPELLDQLDIGGYLLAPVGPQGQQELKLYRREESGNYSTTTIEQVEFVPLKPGVIRG